jgi:hypothetical protein
VAPWLARKRGRHEALYRRPLTSDRRGDADQEALHENLSEPNALPEHSGLFAARLLRWLCAKPWSVSREDAALKSSANPGGPWGWPSFLAQPPAVGLATTEVCLSSSMRKASLSYVEELELVEHTLVAIQRTAITIAKLPAADRSEALHEFGRAYAIAMGQDTAIAAKWLETVMIGVRELVTEIDKAKRWPNGKVAGGKG